MPTTTKQRPVAEVSVGHIHAAIWRTVNQGVPYYNATFQVRYKAPSGEWKTATNYGPMELLALGKAADLAYNEIAALQRHDTESSPSK
jgi:hypothetical protein